MKTGTTGSARETGAWGPWGTAPTEASDGAGAWDRNPWVAAYSFTVHRCNIDQMGADHG